MKKKIIILLISVIGVLLTACGGDGQSTYYPSCSEMQENLQNIFLRLFSFVRLTIKGIPFKTTKRILLRDKRSESEKKIMRIANQATFSTAEIIKCVEENKTHFATDEEILDTIYQDEDTTSENIAYTVKSSPVCHTVLTDVAKLYLRQQIVFGGV